jgi:hypothetical protein
MKRVEDLLKGRPRALVIASIDRAESLALEVDPAVTYPEDWVVFRVTGENSPPSAHESPLITGQELRAELSPLAERLATAAKLTIEEAGAGALSPVDLCQRWQLSRATLNRLRRRGLVARRVQTASLRATLVFRVDMVQRFERLHAKELKRAAGFSRLTDDESSRLAIQAEELRRDRGWTLNQAAAHLAAELGRSHEGVRQVLKRAAAKGNGSLLDAPAINDDRRAVLYRAWRRGVDLSLMARKTHRSRGAVRRAINMERAERLRELLASGALAVPEPSHAPKKPGPDALTQQPARTGLSTQWPRQVLGFIGAARKQGPPIGAEEKARLAAYQQLRSGAARVIGSLDRLQPSASGVDRVETMLRWASRLKAELVRSQARLLLDTLASRLGKPVEELSPGVVVRVLEGGLRVIGEAVDAHDAAKSARLAAAAGLALDRYSAVVAKELAPTPAQSRRAVSVIPADLRLPDWERQVNSWQGVIEPDARLKPTILQKRVPREVAGVLLKRYGWDGGPPRTLAELAVELKLTRIRVLQAEQRAIAAALRAIRTAT